MNVQETSCQKRIGLKWCLPSQPKNNGIIPAKYLVISQLASNNEIRVKHVFKFQKDVLSFTIKILQTKHITQ